MIATDVLVIGAGPAGLATAAACQAVGLRTLCLTRDRAHGWPNNYGCWADELAEVDLQRFAKHRWASARVVLDASRDHTLERAYVQVDNAALRAHLRRHVELREAQVEAIDDVVRLASGDTIAARLVVDASGHQPAFTRRVARENPGFQAAIGWLARVDAWPFPLDQMRLMDFSPGAGPDHPATFLYAMPFGPDRVFVEETSLCARPALDFATLEARLQARLAHLGVTVREVEAVERCYIPMGLPLPRRGRVVAMGGAASMVHPATGYMFAHVLRTAPRLAEAVKRAFDQGLDPVPAAWDAVWPRDRVRTRALYTFGMEALLAMDAGDLREFFDAFFHAPRAPRERYLAGTATPAEAAATMRAVFARLPNGLRARLVGRTFSGGGLRMLRALLG